MGKISSDLTTTKPAKVWDVCIFQGIQFMYPVCDKQIQVRQNY